MNDLANKKQALRIEWEKMVKEAQGNFYSEEFILRFGERCFDLGVKAKGMLSKARDDG